MYPGAPLWSPARLGGVWGTLRVSDKLFCMGISKKRLTATQANVGSAHFFRTWSESALRPPSCAEGPRKDPSPPAPPPWPSVGRCLAWVSERLPGTAARARSPARPRRAYGFPVGAPLEGGLGRAEWCRAGARGAPGSRVATGWDRATVPGSAATVPESQPRLPVSARPRPPPAGPRRPQPPAALCSARGAPRARNGRAPASDLLSEGHGVRID